MKNDFGVSRWKPKILKIHSKYLIYNTNFLIPFFSFHRVLSVLIHLFFSKIKYSVLKFKKIKRNVFKNAFLFKYQTRLKNIVKENSTF